MKTVCETVIEERPMDVYHIEYEEVIDKVKVPVIKYKEGTAYRCCCVTVNQLPLPCAACAAAACALAATSTPAGTCARPARADRRAARNSSPARS